VLVRQASSHGPRSVYTQAELDQLDQLNQLDQLDTIVEEEEEEEEEQEQERLAAHVPRRRRASRSPARPQRGRSASPARRPPAAAAPRQVMTKQALHSLLASLRRAERPFEPQLYRLRLLFAMHKQPADRGCDHDHLDTAGLGAALRACGVPSPAFQLYQRAFDSSADGKCRSALVAWNSSPQPRVIRPTAALLRLTSHLHALRPRE